jgi:hypothetical protein
MPLARANSTICLTSGHIGTLRFRVVHIGSRLITVVIFAAAMTAQLHDATNNHYCLIVITPLIHSQF